MLNFLENGICLIFNWPCDLGTLRNQVVRGCKKFFRNNQKVEWKILQKTKIQHLDRIFKFNKRFIVRFCLCNGAEPPMLQLWHVALDHHLVKEHLISRSDNRNAQILRIILVAKSWIAPAVRMAVNVTCNAKGEILHRRGNCHFWGQKRNLAHNLGQESSDIHDSAMCILMQGRVPKETASWLELVDGAWSTV